MDLENEEVSLQDSTSPVICGEHCNRQTFDHVNSIDYSDSDNTRDYLSQSSVESDDDQSVIEL